MKFYERVTFRRKWIAMQLLTLHGVTNETNKFIKPKNNKNKKEETSVVEHSDNSHLMICNGFA